MKKASRPNSERSRLSQTETILLQANVEKDRLEEKQRVARRERVDQGFPACTPRWFEQLPARNDEELPRWRYKGGYWEAREAGTWTDIPDIYGKVSSVPDASSLPGKAAMMLT